MKITFDSQTLELIPTGSGKSYRATLGDKTVVVEIVRVQGGQLELLIDSQHLLAFVSSDGTKRWVTVNGQTFVLTKSTAGTRTSGHGHHHAAGALTAPMPGQVRTVNVSEGETVTKGQTLMVLEAMKMEIRVQATVNGKVRKLFVTQGQTVEREHVLVEIE